MTGPVTVTQADREGWREMKPIAEMVQAEFDAAIARARIEGARMGLEAAAKVAEIMGSEWNPERSKFDAVRHDEAHGIATAVRQTDPAQIVKGQSDG
jgi:hypothetical protein